MSRLTKKIFNSVEGYAVNNVPNESDGIYYVSHNVINKLGKLEDLEEELGCPLEVVVKKIKELMEENENKTDYNCCLEYSSTRKLWYIQDYCYYWGSYDVYSPELYLKDYQKTWWLRGERDEKAN